MNNVYMQKLRSRLGGNTIPTVLRTDEETICPQAQLK